MKNVYFIGGSPCCGKSTIAERLVKKYGFFYYKVDDYLDKYIIKGANDGDEWLTYIASMTLDDLWLRDPEILNQEELRTYERLLPYFLSDLEHVDENAAVITEGAAFLPNLMKKMGVATSRYVCIAPTKSFQVQHYAKRSWINHYLSSCSDKKRAFENWMERDALFALSALEQAREVGYRTLIVDGNQTIEENVAFIEKSFNLS